MPINPDLATRIWMHSLTHVLYKVVDDYSGTNEPKVRFSIDDGKSWNQSVEYTMRDFVEDIQKNVLRLKFIAKQADADGLEYVRSVCQAQLNKFSGKGQPGASKRESGAREGITSTLTTVIELLDETLARGVVRGEDGTLRPLAPETEPEETHEPEELGSIASDPDNTKPIREEDETLHEYAARLREWELSQTIPEKALTSPPPREEAAPPQA